MRELEVNKTIGLHPLGTMNIHRKFNKKYGQWLFIFVALRTIMYTEVELQEGLNQQKYLG